MAAAKPGRSTKRGPIGFAAKVALAIVLGLSFIVIWSTLSPSSSSEQVSTERGSFGDISDPESELPTPKIKNRDKEKEKEKEKSHSNVTLASPPPPEKEILTQNETVVATGEEKKGEEKKEEEQMEGMEGDSTGEKKESETEPEILEETSNGDDLDTEDSEGDEESDESGIRKKRNKNKNKKKLGPLFDPAIKYHWKQCGGKSGNNFIPCLDFEGDASQRHHERSCPKSPFMCLISLPRDYKLPEPWPERESKIWYSNVGHPRLSSYIKSHSWLNLSGGYLSFSREKSEFKGGADHYLDSIEEMVPDIEWGKNIRVVLDIGCVTAGFGSALLKKNVLTLTLGLMNDQINLAQLALERGIPVILSNLGSRRLPFPSGVFDAIHCGECNIAWHHNGGRLLLEMNRILRPGGYFITSSKHGDIETEEGMRNLLGAVCWNVLAHKMDDISELGLRIYQRPASNEIYELRTSKNPPFCREDENQDSAWYIQIRTCLHKVPSAIEERGSDWPEEWPARLEKFPDWLGDLQSALTIDHQHWKSVFDRSYLNGLGIDWSTVRNVLDMKSVYGGFAAALTNKKVWVMNVVPVHAPNTLPIIFERGLVGVYHDWCEPFSTYPRSYDLLHADHLFSRLKNRCKQPVVIVVEMDRILRPGGWAIIRDKLEILNPLETILKSLHWEIRMTYSKDKEGIICAQKTLWRP